MVVALTEVALQQLLYDEFTATLSPTPVLNLVL